MFKIQKKCKWGTKQGFTLIETLVAISILLTAIAGPMTIASKGLSSAVFARDQITAFYLAQEAVEHIRNVRDENVFKGNGWLDTLGPCMNGTPCTVDAPNASVQNCSGGTCDALLFAENTGFFNHQSGDETKFIREVEVESVNANEASISVTISWRSGTLDRSFSIREHLLEWLGGLGGPPTVPGDGGTGGGGGGGSGGGTDLIARYRADDYTAGNWPDRTGNGFDLSQSTGANQPTAVSDGGFEFGGQPVVRFDGSDDFLERASTPSLPQPHTKVIIAKTVADSSNSKFVVGSIDDSARGDIFFNSNEQVQTYAGSGLTGTDSHLNQAVLAEALFDGSSSAIRVNGAVESIGDAGSQTSIGLRVGLPSYDLVSQAFDGDIAEILIYDGPLSESERQALADYAADRYGIGRTDLVAHYRADDYSAGSWPDRTGNGFNLSQGTAGNQPTAIANGGFEFGNQPVVRFDGVNDFLKDTSLTLSQPLTYVVIQKLTLDNSTTKTIVDGTTASNRAALAFLSNEAPVIYGGAQLDGSGSLHNVSTLIEAFYDGTSSSLRVDGELNVSGNAGTLTSAGLTVGTYYDTDANWYAGDIADILIYDGPLSADERQDLLDYAAERYGVNQILLLAGDTGNEVAAFTKSGDILLAGTLTQNGTPAATSDDELVFKDGNGDTVALLNTVTGDMLIAGSLFANQQTLAPSSASDDFVMQDDDGTVVIYFDDSGNLYLKGDVEENASF